MTAKRLGFFTRLLDQTDAGGRYRLATEQIVRGELVGFQTAWVAQHHFLEAEGGLPSPFVLLAHIAARTSGIRLGTGVVTLPLEDPLRAAEDAAVFDLLSDGRLELGVGSGGNPQAFAPFGLENARRTEVYIQHLRTLRAALRGDALDGAGAQLYPAAPQLLDRIWQATFSADGGRWAGLEGDGLLLSRTQPRPAGAPTASLWDIQAPVIDAYLAALPAGRAPRIMCSRTLFVADDRDEALHYAAVGLRRLNDRLKALGRPVASGTLAELIAASDTHVGTPEEVIASLRADRTLDQATDLVFQVHSVDPPHALILRSIELIAQQVAPALGWQKPEVPAGRALQAAL
jgi:putative FMN-dependent luciferase-like monooxygenase